MIGEFKVDLIKYDQDKLTGIFAKEYTDTLEAAYMNSSFKDGQTYQKSRFCAGAFAGSKLLLIFNMQADMLLCIVETPGGSDLGTMKKAVNLYYRQVTKILKKNKIKWREPLSTISLERFPSEGRIQGLRTKLKEMFKERWEKLILAPIASILASYAAIQLNILGQDEALKDVKKAVTLTLEAYTGLVLVLFFTILFQVKRKEFTFTI